MSCINNPQLLSALSSLNLAKSRQAGHKGEHEAYLTTLRSRQQLNLDELRSLAKGSKRDSDKASETSDGIESNSKRSASQASSSTSSRHVWKDTLIVDESGIRVKESPSEPAVTTPSVDSGPGDVFPTEPILMDMTTSDQATAAALPALQLDQVFDHSTAEEILRKLTCQCASAGSAMTVMVAELGSMALAGEGAQSLDLLARLEVEADKYLTAVMKAREAMKELSKW